MSSNESIIEKYRRELMEMHSRAKTEIQKEEPLPDWTQEDMAEKEEPMPDFVLEDENCTEQEETENEVDTCEIRQSCEEKMEEESVETMDEMKDEQNEKGQTDKILSVCPICGGGIALCEFIVEESASGKPIEYAQIMLYKDDGYFVRTLTGEDGKTCAIPVFAEERWRVSITAQGYIPVSKAPVYPAAGEKLTVPVRLDESLTLSDVFTERSGEDIIASQ